MPGRVRDLASSYCFGFAVALKAELAHLEEGTWNVDWSQSSPIRPRWSRAHGRDHSAPSYRLPETTYCLVTVLNFDLFNYNTASNKPKYSISLVKGADLRVSAHACVCVNVSFLSGRIYCIDCIF